METLPSLQDTNIIVPTKGVGKGMPHFREYYGSAQKDMNDEYHDLFTLSSEEILPGDVFYCLKAKKIKIRAIDHEVTKWHNATSLYDRKVIGTTSKVIHSLVSCHSDIKLLTKGQELMYCQNEDIYEILGIQKTL